MRYERLLLRLCWIQLSSATPRPVWNPDVESPINHFDGWMPALAKQDYDNPFKIEWELFLRPVVKEDPFRWNLLEGAKGAQLAEKPMESWRKRAWVDVAPLA